MQIQSFLNIKQNTKANFYFGLGAVNFLALGFLFGFLKPGDIDTDGGIFAAVALKDISGGTLYLNAWENKPPGIIYLIEILIKIIPNRIYAMYAMPIIGILGIVNGLYLIVNGMTKSFITSILVLALFILFTINNRTIGDALYTELYGCIFIIWSLCFYHIFNENKNIKTAYLSAFLLGFSFWFKEPFIILSAPILLQLFFKMKAFKNIILTIFFFSVPSILFIILLFFNGSLNGFIEMIIYNFSFSGAKGSVTRMEQLNTIWYNIVEPLLLPFLIFLMLGYKGFKDKKMREDVVFNFLLFLSGMAFIFISPHSFNHYYIPLIIIFFYCLSTFLKMGKLLYPGAIIIFNIVLVYSIYKQEQRHDFDFKLKIDSYKEDNIVKILKSKKGKTLFVDLVDASGYYIKGDILYPTFLPVPIAAHFSDSKSGIVNRVRIYKELSQNKPDYLITEQTSSYMYWQIPDQSLYYSNYIKVDSLIASYGKNVILWKLKQH